MIAIQPRFAGCFLIIAAFSIRLRAAEMIVSRTGDVQGVKLHYLICVV
jgi:hypothetical protein